MSIAEALAKSIAHVAQEHYRQKKAAERHGSRSYRAWYRPPRDVLKEDVFEVMPAAVAAASGGGALPFKVRQLYYQVRPLLQDLTDKTLEYAYFTPALVTEYEELHGPIPGLLYDARGTFTEPHTGKAVPLGTAEVSNYAVPDWTFDKILYIEKEGFAPVLEAAKFAERFDVGIMGGKGYATRAAKDLLARAEAHGVTVLVAHDCDGDGRQIARTLAEGTRTRPSHSLNIIDIGLHASDAAVMGLAAERTRAGERVELNAMTSRQFIDFLEQRLDAHGLTEKVIPPDASLPELTAERYRKRIDAWVEDATRELLSMDQIKHLIADQFEGKMGLSQSRRWITKAFRNDPAQSWGHALDNAIQGRLEKRQATLRRVLEKEIRASVRTKAGP